MLRLYVFTHLVWLILLGSASARLLLNAASSEGLGDGRRVTSLSGRLEIVEVNCRREPAYDENAVEPLGGSGSSRRLAQIEEEDVHADNTPTEVVFSGLNDTSLNEENNTHIEYYLTIENSTTGAPLSQKRLYFQPGRAPRGEISTGWFITIQGRTAAGPQEDACSNETFTPVEDPNGDLNNTNAVIVDDWTEIGGLMSSEATWPPASGSVWNVTSVTYILNLCGSSLTISQSMVTATWFSFNASSSTPSLQQNWAQCSYNQYSFTPSNNIVVGPINVPCTGVRADGVTPFRTATCGGDDRYGWAEYAENYAQTVLGIDITPYRHGIFIVNNPACSFTGMANAGCGDYCRVWLTSGGASSVPTVNSVFHELGHNFFLNHAVGIDGSEYGDLTSGMGGCCATRCYNTPQHMQIGWSSPIPNGIISNSVLPEATWRSFTVPSQSMTNQSSNYMQILTQSWLSNPLSTGTTYYIGYKSAYGYDRFLSSTLLRKVNVYTWDGVSQTSFVKTQIRAQLAARGTFTDTITRLRVRAVSTALARSTVSICRWRATSTAAMDCP